MTQSGIEFATFRLEAWCLNKLHHHLPVLTFLFYFISVKNCINTDSQHLIFVRYYLKLSHRRKYFTHSV
jgi:hypothetical protein